MCFDIFHLDLLLDLIVHPEKLRCLICTCVTFSICSHSVCLVLILLILSLCLVSGLGLVSYGGHDEESDQEAKNSDVEEEKDSPHSTQNEQVITLIWYLCHASYQGVRCWAAIS